MVEKSGGWGEAEAERGVRWSDEGEGIDEDLGGREKLAGEGRIVCQREFRWRRGHSQGLRF